MAEKLLNIGDTIYQNCWSDFEGSVFPRVVDCVIYVEHKKPEDCFYKYSLQGFAFGAENMVTNGMLGRHWFWTEAAAREAVDKEIAEAKANHIKALEQDIASAKKKLSEL